jgi:WD40 repeat protein
MRNRPLLTFAAALTFASPILRAADAPPAAPKVTYQDHVLPVLRNTCLNCHNPDKKKGNLDLSTYTGAVTGGGSGKAFEPGDPEASMIYKVITWSIEPNMPPKGDKIPDKDIALIKAWIAAGAPETSGSKVVINKPKSNLAVVAVTGKPQGPVAMPKDLSIEPVVTARHPGALTALAASPWAPIIAVGGQRQIILYHAQTLETLGILPFPEGLAYSLKFSRNGSILLAAGGIGAKSGKVVAFDVATGNRVAEVGDEFDAILAADVSPDQSQVAFGTPLKTLKIYNTSDGSQEQLIKKHTDWVQAVAYSADGRFLASGDRAGGLWVWEAKTARELYNCAGHKDAVTDAAFRGDSNILASASQDGTIKLWNMSDGTLAKTINNAHPGGVLSLAFTHDGRLVSCGRDGQVKLWTPDGSPLKNLEKFGDIALHAAFDNDGQRVVAGDFTGAIRVWSVADGKRVGELTANPLPLAEQLVNFDQRLKDLQAAADKSAAELKSAQAAVEQAGKQRVAATAAQGAASQLVEKLQGELATATKEASAKSEAAKETLAPRKSAATAAAATRDGAKSAAAGAAADLQGQKAGLAAARTAADAAFTAAGRAREKSAASPDDVALVSALKERAVAAANAASEVEARLKAVAARAADLKVLADKLAKAEADAKSTAAALADAESAAKPADAHPRVVAAKQSLAKAKSDADAAAKALDAANKANKSAADRLAKADADAKSTAQAIDTAKAHRTRVEASLNKQTASKQAVKASAN